jgi:hypothetical protein
MFPDDSTMFNQLADDRDHSFFDLPTIDSVGLRLGQGQGASGVSVHREAAGPVHREERATGYASTAGKYASTFALAAPRVRRSDPAFARRLRERAARRVRVRREISRQLSRPRQAESPYFYEEENWWTTWSSVPPSSSRCTHDAAFCDDAVRLRGA